MKRSWCGSWFQAFGPANEIARSLNFLESLGLI